MAPLRRATAAAAFAALAAASGAAAAQLEVRSGPLSLFALPFELFVDTILASVDIEPEVLQRKSEGDHVTVFVALPEGRDVADIDVGSLLLCAGIEPCSSGIPADRAHVVSGGRTLKARFDREAMIALVAGIATPQRVFFTVTGFVRETRFVGTDQVRVIGP